MALIEIICQFCQKPFKVKSSYLASHPNRKFCVRKHFHAYQRGENHHLFGKKSSIETRLKISASMTGKTRLDKRGENNPNWRGGVYLTNRDIRRSPEYKRWQKAVYARDNFVCQMCGGRNGRLEADHIKSFADFPELRFVIENGRTLCQDCHYMITYGKPKFQERLVA